MITLEQQKLQSRVEQLEKELEILKKDRNNSMQFWLRIFQELRIPINSVLGFSEILQEDDLTREEVMEFCQNISKDSLHMVSLITDVCELLQLENNTLSINPAPTNLDDLLDRVLIIEEQELFNRGISNIKLTVDAEREPEKQCYFIVDDQRVSQIFTTMIHHSIQLSEHGGDIVFGYFREDDKNICFVRATGLPQLEESRVNNAFNPYEQLNDWFTLERGEARIGLAIAKALIEAMNGEIWIESGIEGTTVKFHIPCSG